MNPTLQMVDFFDAFITLVVFGGSILIGYGLYFSSWRTGDVRDKEYHISKMYDDYVGAALMRTLVKHDALDKMSLVLLQKMFYHMYGESKIARVPWNKAVDELPTDKITILFIELTKEYVDGKRANSDHYQLGVFNVFNRYYRPILNELSQHQMNEFSHWGN